MDELEELEELEKLEELEELGIGGGNEEEEEEELKPLIGDARLQFCVALLTLHFSTLMPLFPEFYQQAQFVVVCFAVPLPLFFAPSPFSRSSASSREAALPNLLLPFFLDSTPLVAA